MWRCTANTQKQEPYTASFLGRVGVLIQEGFCPFLLSPKCEQSSSLWISHRRNVELSLILSVWDKWITNGLQRKVFKCSWSFSLFSWFLPCKAWKLVVCVCFFFFCTLKGINVLWRGDGLVFLKCLLCYYCSKKEISSALSWGSQGSLGGQRDIMFPFLNSRYTAKRKS